MNINDNINYLILLTGWLGSFTIIGFVIVIVAMIVSREDK